MPPRMGWVSSTRRTSRRELTTLTASAAGFSTLVRNRITLTVGQELVLNLTLAGREHILNKSK